jgi:hypothetical protein
MHKQTDSVYSNVSNATTTLLPMHKQTDSVYSNVSNSTTTLLIFQNRFWRMKNLTCSLDAILGSTCLLSSWRKQIVWGDISFGLHCDTICHTSHLHIITEYTNSKTENTPKSKNSVEQRYFYYSVQSPPPPPPTTKLAEIQHTKHKKQVIHSIYI